MVWLSWNDALGYARWAGVDLPTESEWLHACRAYEWCKLEERYGAGEGATGYPRGGSWARCPDRFLYDLPIVGGPRYAVIPFDDDRGIRCIRRGEGPVAGVRNTVR